MEEQSEIEVRNLDDEFAVTYDSNQNREVQPVKSRSHRFRMRHFFYIHLIVFIISTLFGGLTIFLIENDSAPKNRQMKVSFIDAWFVTCTCICGCGLTTLNFAKLSRVSQMLLLILTFFFGITISTLPALIIKAKAYQSVEKVTNDNNDEEEVQNIENRSEEISSQRTSLNLPSDLESKFALLPTAEQIRFRAYLTIFGTILLTCAVIYIGYFIIIGAWLYARYSGGGLNEGNTTINPWYTSIIIVVTGFNQNGLTPFSDGMARFVNDVYMNIFVMMVIHRCLVIVLLKLLEESRRSFFFSIRVSHIGY